MLFATVLRRKIKYADTTQKQVAQKLGVTATTVYYWCSNRARPDLDHLRQLEQLFGCPPGELLIACAYETPDMIDVM